MDIREFARLGTPLLPCQHTIEPSRSLLGLCLIGLGWAGLVAGCGVAADPDEGVLAGQQGEANATAGSREWIPWLVDTVPVMSIGESGGEDYELASVAFPLRFDGGYIVTTGLPVGVRLFDNEGRFLRWLGREGEGPGEFRAISYVWIAPEDTIGVFDPFQNRLTYFDADGTLLGTSRHEPGGSARVGDSRPRQITGRFSDGSFLARQWVLPDQPQGSGSASGTSSVRFLREVMATGSVDAITEVADQEHTWDVIPGEPVGYWGMVPLTPSAAGVAHDTFLIVTESRRFEINIWSIRGNHVGRFVKEYDPQPITDDVWDVELARRLSAYTEMVESTGNRWGLNLQGELAAIRRQFQRAVRPEHLPVHGSRILVDPDENIWIRGWSADPNTPSRTWHIFLAETQRFVGEVEVPAGFRPTAVYDNTVLGVHRDELNVESVREYRIVR